MTISEPVATRATELLLTIAAGESPAAEQAAEEYAALLFPLLRATAIRRGRFLAQQAAQRLGSGLAPMPRAADLEEAGVWAAEVALERARASASRFDHTLGDGASWALGALGTAYLDAVRQLTGARRSMSELPVDDLDAVEQNQATRTADPAIVAEARDNLRQALLLLSEEERHVIVAALHYGMSHREIAAYLFSDAAQFRKVERILARARAKLRALHEQWLQEP